MTDKPMSVVSPREQFHITLRSMERSEDFSPLRLPSRRLGVSNNHLTTCDLNDMAKDCAVSLDEFTQSLSKIHSAAVEPFECAPTYLEAAKKHNAIFFQNALVETVLQNVPAESFPLVANMRALQRDYWQTHLHYMRFRHCEYTDFREPHEQSFEYFICEDTFGITAVDDEERNHWLCSVLGGVASPRHLVIEALVVKGESLEALAVLFGLRIAQPGEGGNISDLKKTRLDQRVASMLESLGVCPVESPINEAPKVVSPVAMLGMGI